MPAPALLPTTRDFQEGEFSQCSFNAVASVLRYFYGPNGPISDVTKFEQETFRGPLDATGYGSFFGWGPWTSYMVESHRMIWNRQLVTELHSERFALRPAVQPVAKGRLIIVKYSAGEREKLRTKFLSELNRGPVVMWSPYAAAQDATFFQPWHHVSRIDDYTDAVLFGPFTHSIAVCLLGLPIDRKGDTRELGETQIQIADSSVRNGVFLVDLDTLISNSAAMTTYVRLSTASEKSIFDRGLSGVLADEYNVVFFKRAATGLP